MDPFSLHEGRLKMISCRQPLSHWLSSLSGCLLIFYYPSHLVMSKAVKRVSGGPCCSIIASLGASRLRCQDPPALGFRKYKWPLANSQLCYRPNPITSPNTTESLYGYSISKSQPNNGPLIAGNKILALHRH